MRRYVTSLLLTIGVALLLPPARAGAEIRLGGAILGVNATHVETNENTSSPAAVPLISLNATHQRFEIHSEWTGPLPSLKIGSGSFGLQSIKLDYFDGSIRYWVAPSRVAIGIGQLLWNQRTKYIDSPLLTEYDASRGAGMRYEIVGDIPIGHGSLESIVAVAPHIHARLSWTFEPGFITRQGTSEQESEVDTSLGYVWRASRWRLGAGLRYINLTAKYDDGEFADANHVVGPYFKFDYSLGGR